MPGRVAVIVLPRSGEIDQRHARFDPVFDVEVGVEVLGWPEIDERNPLVSGTDSVDPTEALDDADRVPVYVVIDKQITVLKVLAFRDAIRRDEEVDLLVLGKFGLSIPTL
jgi:hypothetical protein